MTMPHVTGRTTADVSAPRSGAAPAATPNVRLVETDAEFDALESSWNDLLDRSPATIYQTFEWQRTWWKYFGKGKRLAILVFTEPGDGGASDGRVAGIAPLFRERERLLGVPVATRLQFIGAGLSDYLSVIAAAGSEERVLGALARWLFDHRSGWTAFDLEDIPEADPAFRLLPAFFGAAGLRVVRYRGAVCPRIDLPETEEALLGQLGPSSSYNLKRKMKRLHVNFRSTVRLVRRPSDPIDEAITDFASIHGGRWKSQGHPSAFDDPHHRAFHAEACRRIAARDWLRIFFLDVEGTPVAVSFSFNFRSTIYMYQSNAHGSDEVMKCSPGLLVRYTAMTAGIREGMKVFDFMRGDESYKYREWDARDERNWLLRSASPGGAATVRFPLFLLAEFLRKAADRLRREVYEYRRYRITSGDEGVSPPAYVLTKLVQLARMARDFVVRHLPGSGRSAPAGDASDRNTNEPTKQ